MSISTKKIKSGITDSAGLILPFWRHFMHPILIEQKNHGQPSAAKHTIYCI